MTTPQAEHWRSVPGFEVPSLAEELIRTGARSNGRGRPWKDRTHCLRGHEYTPDNTLWRTHGARLCRICHRAAGRKWYAERGAAARAARRNRTEQA